MTTVAAPTSTDTAQRTALALTILRVIVGLIFMAHGYQKFFMYTLPGTTGAFTEMGIPGASLAAPAVATLELLGGLALMLGIGTRFAAALLALTILGALLMVHLKAGFFNPGGIEFPLVLFGGAVALALAGPGAYALDTALSKNR
ncbi:quinol oxidase [Deinococcus piscis]|uniref:Quinol oxidase n=1 Tax=Deinococcus piscis TaxID=394230 RepID=A0ABQ3K9H6_9DEIO|nr:DoxX family protein [Deinococcus piscis]GHG01142.1 quinol oxidase [Deinococcus piscis]